MIWTKVSKYFYQKSIKGEILSQGNWGLYFSKLQILDCLRL